MSRFRRKKIDFSETYKGLVNIIENCNRSQINLGNNIFGIKKLFTGTPN